jgi:hypothetical protein
MPRPLYPRGEGPWYPFSRRLGGPQSRSGRRGEEKILEPTGTRTLSPSVVQPVASRYIDYAIPAPQSLTIRDLIVKINLAPSKLSGEVKI